MEKISGDTYISLLACSCVSMTFVGFVLILSLATYWLALISLVKR